MESSELELETRNETKKKKKVASNFWSFFTFEEVSCPTALGGFGFRQTDARLVFVLSFYAARLWGKGIPMSGVGFRAQNLDGGCAKRL